MFFLISDASSPADKAPMNAAAAGGIPVKSISSSRNVLATSPIYAAMAAMGMVLLNIIENPNTPQKLAMIRRHRSRIGFRLMDVNVRG